MNGIFGMLFLLQDPPLGKRAKGYLDVLDAAESLLAVLDDSFSHHVRFPCNWICAEAKDLLGVCSASFAHIPTN